MGLSVFAHGLTAAPLADRYADWCERPLKPGAGDVETPVEADAPSYLSRSSTALDT